jgi:hypothetical protein
MKELLIKLRKEAERGGLPGLCITVYNMKQEGKLDNYSCFCLEDYLEKNLPSKDFEGYCWPGYKKEPRIKWLNEQIAKFEGEEKSNFWAKIRGIFTPKK